MTEFLRTHEVKPLRKDMIGGDENTNGNLKLTKGNFTWSRRFVELLDMQNNEQFNPSFRSEMDSNLLL